VRGNDYHVDWIDSDGRRTMSPKLTYDWHRLTDAEKTRLVDSVNAYYQAHANRSPTVSLAAESLPDYGPAFVPSSVVADADGDVWVELVPTRPTDDGKEYDVIDRAGKLVARVQLKVGFDVVGFGPASRTSRHARQPGASS